VIIDIHGHLTPPQAAGRFPMPPSLTDVDGMLAARADAGIDLTIIGSPVGAGAMMRVPGIDNYRQSRDKLRVFHEWLAELVEAHPDHLRAYVYANPLGDDDHLAGVAETLSGSAFVGIIMNSSVQGDLLQSAAADGFFAMAAEAGCPVLVHPPAEPVGGPAVADFRFVEQIGRFCDVTAGLAMLAFAGWLDKYPRLRLVGATGGGAVAALPERLDQAARPRPWGPPAAPPTAGGPGGPGSSGGPGGSTGGPGGPGGSTGGPRTATTPQPALPTSPAPGAALRRLYVDTAVASPAHLRMNVDVLGPEKVMFGTDSPPLDKPLKHLLDTIRALPIDDGSKARILGGNAIEIFDLGIADRALVASNGQPTSPAPVGEGV
jgi:aminocarboxymuconate-semialdehyde decarboxylase